MSRLRDHVERLDSGAEAAVDDLAVVLRTLVTRTDGGKVFERVLRAHGLAPPEVTVTAAPQVAAGTRFALGSLPCSPAASRHTRGRTVTLDRLGRERLFVVRGEFYDWDRFLREYSNKWGGSHLDDHVPAALVLLEDHVLQGMSLPTYLMRLLAVTLWPLAQQVLGLVVPRAPGQGDYERGILLTPGGIEGPPRDWPSPAHLLTLLVADETASAQWLLTDASEAARLGVLRLGGLEWQWDFTPSHEAEPQAVDMLAPSPEIRPRVPVRPPPSFSLGKRLTIGGFVFAAADDDEQQLVAAPGQVHVGLRNGMPNASAETTNTTSPAASPDGR